MKEKRLAPTPREKWGHDMNPLSLLHEKEKVRPLERGTQNSLTEGEGRCVEENLHPDKTLKRKITIECFK